MTTSTSSLSSCKHDVFISFRGANTRNNFTSHLYAALSRKQIQVYKDDKTLPRGDEISPVLLEAIEDSKIAIVVFSENFAKSRWCMDELVHILECKREKGQIFLPVFYKVDPSVVRKQKRSYAEAFDVEHEKTDSWRSALEEAGNHSGWDSHDRSEHELVEEIAKDTLEKLSISATTAGGELQSNFVGIEKHVDKVVSMLRFDEKDVRIIGIWGMGGIGKTTLAEVINKQFGYQFYSSFFEDVSNKVKTIGQRSLGELFYAKLLKEKDVDINNNMNVERLRHIKVLVVLDNVDDLQQLELLGDASNKFGKGSRIILTSRNKKLLDVADDIYKVESLSSEDAVELFLRKAFKDRSIINDKFTKLSMKVVYYTGGNPLALKVLGSSLCSRSIEEWKSVWSRLKKFPDKKVQEVLRISYDALDQLMKSIFLDIGCFFKGNERERVEVILGEESHIGINILIENCLITIDENGQIRMHDLIQQMAWDIVGGESVVIGQRSRLWNIEDTISVLKNNKGSGKNEVVFLDMGKMSNDLWLKPTVFEAMENLRIIKTFKNYSSMVENRLIHFDQGLQHLPDSLKYLHWYKYPLESLPPEFEPRNLIKLDMTWGKLTKLWDGVKRLNNLKHVDLSGSANLIELPDLSKAKKLEHLNLSFCFGLRCIPKLNRKLKYLKLFSCKNLESLPDLPSSLQNLDLTNCWSLKSLPDLPSSLQHLNLKGCKNLESLPDLPSSLQHLILWGCKKLKCLPDHLPSSLKSIDIFECENLEHLPELSSLYKFRIGGHEVFTTKLAEKSLEH